MIKLKTLGGRALGDFGGDHSVIEWLMTLEWEHSINSSKNSYTSKTYLCNHSYLLPNKIPASTNFVDVCQNFNAKYC